MFYLCSDKIQPRCNDESLSKKTALAAGGLLAATPFASIMAKDNDSLEKTNKYDKQMKVLLINGSARREGNTFVALSEVAKTLEQQGIEAEIVQIGTKAVRGCNA